MLAGYMENRGGGEMTDKAIKVEGAALAAFHESQKSWPEGMVSDFRAAVRNANIDADDLTGEDVPPKDAP